MLILINVGKNKWLKIKILIDAPKKDVHQRLKILAPCLLNIIRYDYYSFFSILTPLKGTKNYI